MLRIEIPGRENMNEIDLLREQLRVATAALAVIAADNAEAIEAWISDGCDPGDAIDHVRDMGETAERALGTVKATGPAPLQTIVKIGSTGSYTCYLNTTAADATRRFAEDTGTPFDETYQSIETMQIRDRVQAYDLWASAPARMENAS